MDIESIDIWFPVLHGPNGEDGVIQGFFGVKSDFIRTPKFNIINRDYVGTNIYDRVTFKPVLVFEFLLMLYSFFGDINLLIF